MFSHRKIASLAFLTALALSCSVAGADELVRFQDGRYLKVEGHQFHGDAVKLLMANRSVMVLPLERIDSIRSGRVVIYAAAGSRAATAAEPPIVVQHQNRRYREDITNKRGRS